MEKRARRQQRATDGGDLSGRKGSGPFVAGSWDGRVKLGGSVVVWKVR